MPPTPFTVMSELYGDAGSVARWQQGNGLATGWDFHPVLTTGEQSFLESAKPPFAYFSIPSGTTATDCYPSSTDANTEALLTNLTQQLGPNVWRLGMPEFDQGGGCWARGRPSFGGQTDQQAYNSWTNFYLNTQGLGAYLGQTPQQRGYRWMSLCDFAFCPQYAYDMGSDLVLLERNEDEVSGITPGIAMLRGAAAEHGGKQWGIDLSTWRYWNDGPTVYDSTGKLVTGWSTSTFERNMYIAYMSGANIIHNEAADYTTGGQDGGLNPLGRTVQRFTDFATVRHPDRGTPYVPIALMQGHYSGFEPRFGAWMQGPYKWYWSDPYSAGDTMLSNLLSLAYPRYNTWGTPIGPWVVHSADGSVNVSASINAYRQQLADGADPRPWEPFGSSRWGETFDVITDGSTLATMQQYRAIVLSTGTTIDATMLGNLTQYVQSGGTLVVNAKQLPAGADTLTGVHFTGARGSASSETWVPDASTIDEDAYDYAVATPTSASVLAHTSSGDPIVTSNAYGSGVVYVTTPDFMGDASGTTILHVGNRLIDTLEARFAKVMVTGPSTLDYLVNTVGDTTVVTLVNTGLSNTPWTGTLSFPMPGGAYSAREWTQDAAVSTSVSGNQVVINASVPGYGVRVYALTG